MNCNNLWPGLYIVVWNCNGSLWIYWRKMEEVMVSWDILHITELHQNPERSYLKWGLSMQACIQATHQTMCIKKITKPSHFLLMRHPSTHTSSGTICRFKLSSHIHKPYWLNYVSFTKGIPLHRSKKALKEIRVVEKLRQSTLIFKWH